MSIHPAVKSVRRLVQSEGIVSLAMPCFFVLFKLNAEMFYKTFQHLV